MWLMCCYISYSTDDIAEAIFTWKEEPELMVCNATIFCILQNQFLATGLTSES